MNCSLKRYGPGPWVASAAAAATSTVEAGWAAADGRSSGASDAGSSGGDDGDGAAAVSQGGKPRAARTRQWSAGDERRPRVGRRTAAGPYNEGYEELEVSLSVAERAATMAGVATATSLPAMLLAMEVEALVVVPIS